MKTSHRAFTLVEIIVVLGVIIAITAITLAVINPVKQRQRAKDAVLRKTMADIAIALQTFYNAQGRYPTGLTADRNELERYLYAPPYIVQVTAGGTNANAEIRIRRSGLETGQGVGQPIYYMPNPDGNANTNDQCLIAPSNESPTSVYMQWRPQTAVESVTTGLCRAF